MQRNPNINPDKCDELGAQDSGLRHHVAQVSSNLICLEDIKESARSSGCPYLTFSQQTCCPAASSTDLSMAAEQPDLAVGLVGQHEQRLLEEQRCVSKSRVISGLSLFERSLSPFDWSHDVAPTLDGKLFSRAFLCESLDQLADYVCEERVTETALCLYLFARARVVYLLPVHNADAAPTPTGDPAVHDLDVCDQSLPPLEALADIIQEHATYFANMYAQWLSRYYLYVLYAGWESSRGRDARTEVQNRVTHFRKRKAVFGLIVKVGVFQLTKEQRMWLNTLECNSFNQHLIESGLNSVSEGRAVLLESSENLGLTASHEDRPLVTVISVVRDLQKAGRIPSFEYMLETVRQQTYPTNSVEHLVVDGSSTDGTFEYLVSHWRSGRVDKLVSSPDTGLYNAMNKAISYADGDYFLFMNSDDYMAEFALESLVNEAEREGADYVYSDAWQVDGRNDKIGEVVGEIDSVWFKVPFCHQTLLCKSLTAGNTRFDETYKHSMLQYAMDLVLAGYRSSYVPNKTAFYRLGWGLTSAPEHRQAYEREIARAKSYCSDALGIDYETFKGIDQAWRRVKTHEHLSQFLDYIAQIESQYDSHGRLGEFFESVKAYGRQRVNQFQRPVSGDKEERKSLALINSHPFGGAGGAVKRLHVALRFRDAISTTLITRDLRKGRGVRDTWYLPKPQCGWNARQNEIATPEGNTIFTVDESCVDDETIVEIAQKYDAYSLQWTARMLSTDNIRRLLETGKPVVITLRDMEPITGGCHYFHGCTNWRDRECVDCPQIIAGDASIAHKTYQWKKHAWPKANLTFVVLSDISKRIAEQSPISKECRIEKIPNGFDRDAFCCLDKRAVRKSLGFDERALDKYIIGMLPSFRSNVKGFDVAIEAINAAWTEAADFRRDVEVLIAGNPTLNDIERLRPTKKSVGMLEDGPALNAFYSACDILVVPSREETFSNTVAESLLCGTPVFGATAGAIPEMIVEGLNGMTFSHEWELSEIQGKLLQCKRTSFDPFQCRKSIAERFSVEQQVESYARLFDELVNVQTERGSSRKKVVRESEKLA